MVTQQSRIGSALSVRIFLKTGPGQFWGPFNGLGLNFSAATRKILKDAFTSFLRVHEDDRGELGTANRLSPWCKERPQKLQNVEHSEYNVLIPKKMRETIHELRQASVSHFLYLQTFIHFLLVSPSRKNRQ